MNIEDLIYPIYNYFNDIYYEYYEIMNVNKNRIDDNFKILIRIILILIIFYLFKDFFYNFILSFINILH
jgi:hypothetical protein